MRKKSTDKTVQTFTHKGDLRKNIPTAEYQSIVPPDIQQPVAITYERNRDLDPQLIWRGKDEQNSVDLIVHAPPLYIQEKVHPKVLVDDLMKQTRAEKRSTQSQIELFADFNGLPSGDARTEFYQHDGNWTNRMILGDSLQVMTSLAEREGLRGKVQCIYMDPPYGIKFNSNFQWSTARSDVGGRADEITREPEQVKAFRDTWRNGIHSYLTYLRDRLTVARDLLSPTGSFFVQIGDENRHLVRALLDEVFGPSNFVAEIAFATTTGFDSRFIPSVYDTLLWYARDKDQTKVRKLFRQKTPGEAGATKYREARSFEALGNSMLLPDEFVDLDQITSQDEIASGDNRLFLNGKVFSAPRGLHWKTHPDGRRRLARAHRVFLQGDTPRYLRKLSDFNTTTLTNIWTDIGGVQSRSDPKVYVVQTATEVVSRAILMTTDPGDLVLDPTCGSGTTARVAEQWGRRWITIDTSRVALALARSRIMGARFPYYILADSEEGQIMEAKISGRTPPMTPTHGDIRWGFVYERVPHIMLNTISNNAEIDVIWDKWQPVVQKALDSLNEILVHQVVPFKVGVGARAGEQIDFSEDAPTTITFPSGEQAPTNGFVEWEVPRQAPFDWPQAATAALEELWKVRIARQQEIDASISSRAATGFQYLYDRPIEDKSKVRVAGPFTVESLSPHRVLIVNQDDELIDPQNMHGLRAETDDFVSIMLENLKTAGVQQAHKEDKIEFSTLTPWPGELICAEGRYAEKQDSNVERRAAIFIGPEFGTVSRPDLVAAAREAADAGFDVLITCAFNYDAHSSEFNKLGRIPVLKARMNADLHMAADLKNTGAGNLFVIFGEPDIEILPCDDDRIQIKIQGVDVFDPQSGEVRSDDADGIACWFIDTNYNEESFFVRHAYFLGANDPYKSLKTTLKAEISTEAWDSLHSDVSRPFDRPETGRIAVKVINHLGDEVMKVFRVAEYSE